MIAAVPHLLGFHPENSLILITLRGEGAADVGPTMRIDLPPPRNRHAVTEQFVAVVRRQNASAAVLIVIGGGGADPPDDVPHSDLIAALDSALGAAGVPVMHAAWAESTAAGAAWCCYHESGCGGALPDPKETVLAAANAVEGSVTFANREELAALVRLDDDRPAMNRRSNELEQAAWQVEQAGGRMSRAAARQALLRVHDAVAAANVGDVVLGDDEVVRLAAALSDSRVRDACLATAGGEHAAAAERLWLALTRSTPPPERAQPATLLAFSAYLRGDGALASIALEQAEAAMPGHRLAGLLRHSLDFGLPPGRLTVIVADAAADAEALLGGPTG
ncbi:DUF4192 domain-containing protein [Solihabitans fulvus]|nr:DUF4192 domain-containing protein [Solihabitans fulvus]